jgi:hypothetical protein
VIAKKIVYKFNKLLNLKDYVHMSDIDFEIFEMLYYLGFLSHK